MNYVYFLKSVENNWFYVGSTSNLQKRLEQHNSGEVHSTKYRKPYKLIYYEEYENIKVARTREREIKSKRCVKEDILKNLKQNYGPIV